jgi:hypothetical protein
MARAYSGVLGVLAISFLIVRGLLVGTLPNEILSNCLVVFPVFAVIGYCIGFIAEQTVRESVENRFRSEMASLHSAVAGKESDQADSPERKLA